MFRDALVSRLLVPMLVGAVALVAIVGVSLWLTYRTTADTAEVVGERQARELATTLMDLLQDMEAGHRGYLLTREPRYLAPYDAARPRVEEVLQQLRKAVAATAPAEGFDRIAARVHDKLREMADTLELARTGRYNAAQDLARLDRGKQAMDEVRERLGRFIDTSNDHIVARLAAVQSNARLLTWVSVLASLLLALVIGITVWAAVRYTQEIMQARRAVEAANASLESRVEERTLDLSRANEEIQRYAYIVTHDLRAPLVNIVGFTSELEAGLKAVKEYVTATAEEQADAIAATNVQPVVEDEMPEAIGFIRASTSKMDKLINVILKLSREGRRQLRPERVDLKALIETTIASVQHQIEEKGIKVEIGDRLPVITSDRLALEQIFGNLVDNAVKYLASGRPGEIRITATEHHGMVVTEVADNGRGIAPGDHERIFDLFRRSGSQNVSGEGIGLAHVRTLVRRLGGEISVESEVGRGSRFKVRLPKFLSYTIESKDA